jgi:hypothetical protein
LLSRSVNVGNLNSKGICQARMMSQDSAVTHMTSVRPLFFAVARRSEVRRRPSLRIPLRMIHCIPQRPRLLTRCRLSASLRLIGPLPSLCGAAAGQEPKFEDDGVRTPHNKSNHIRALLSSSSLTALGWPAASSLEHGYPVLVGSILKNQRNRELSQQASDSSRTFVFQNCRAATSTASGWLNRLVGLDP